MRAEPVELAFRHAAGTLLDEGTTVLAAVSGGADSMALLVLLHRLASRRRLRLVVAHLDHALRRGSAADARFVAKEAAARGLDCVLGRREVAALRRKDESPEEAARRVRRTFLLETAQAQGASRIATGHTLDDQAETILLRLVRGGGPASLGGMREAGPGPFVRPLLAIERAALRTWLARHGVAFREDPSNRSLRFDRNRLRRLVVPLLAQHLNPRAARHLAAAGARLREDADYLDTLAAQALREASRPGEGVVLDARALRQAPPPLGARMARMALEAAGVDPRRISARHVTALLGLAASPAGALNLPGVRAERQGALLLLARRQVDRGSS
jgi:tRNA(Ile)-lysidine synthase